MMMCDVFQTHLEGPLDALQQRPVHQLRPAAHRALFQSTLGVLSQQLLQHRPRSAHAGRPRRQLVPLCKQLSDQSLIEYEYT